MLPSVIAKNSFCNLLGSHLLACSGDAEESSPFSWQCSRVLSQGGFCSPGDMGNVWRPIWLPQPKGRWGVLLTSSEPRAGVLLSTLQQPNNREPREPDPTVPRLRNLQESVHQKTTRAAWVSLNYNLFKIEFLQHSSPHQYVAVVSNEPVRITLGHVVVMNWHAAMRFIICSIKEVKSDPVLMLRPYVHYLLRALTN